MSSSQAAAQLLDDLVATLVERLVPVLAPAVQPIQPSGWLNAKSAASYLDLSEQAIRARVKRGEIPVHRCDGRLYFDRTELDEYVRGEGETMAELTRTTSRTYDSPPPANAPARQQPPGAGIRR
jgi:excisionase family DNA binding protein